MYGALDIGGTRMRMAVSKNCVDFSEPVIIDTPADPHAAIEMIRIHMAALLAGESLSSCAIGIPGFLSEDQSSLDRSPNLSQWEGFPLKTECEKVLGCPVYLENDAELVALGEAVAGAGKEFEIVAYMTVSTGIGGARIVQKKIDQKARGFEPGQQIVDYHTGQTLEEIASGKMIEKTYAVHPKEFAQTEGWEAVERAVAVGIHNMIVNWSPDVVVVGGSMSNDFDAKRMKGYVDQISGVYSESVEIRLSELGAIGGIHGGFAYLRHLEA